MAPVRLLSRAGSAVDAVGRLDKVKRIERDRGHCDEPVNMRPQSRLAKRVAKVVGRGRRCGGGAEAQLPQLCQ